MKRIIRPADDKLPVARAAGGELESTAPYLCEHLTAMKYDDPPGLRTPGTLTVRTRNAMWVATLRDPDSGMQLQAEADTFEALLLALDALLGTPDAPWTADPYAKPKPKGKR